MRRRRSMRSMMRTMRGRMRSMRMRASTMYRRVRKRRKSSTGGKMKTSNMVLIGAALVAVWYFFVKKK